jgi:signal transduction histidine kinase
MSTGFGDAGLDVTVEIEGNHEWTPAGVQLSVYRIVQEALTNALRYGGRTAYVRIAASPSEVVLDVSNPPRSAHGDPVVSGGGHGLMGMRERAAVFGGVLDAGPTSDGGFRVRTTFRSDVTPPNDARSDAIPSAGRVSNP